jgi:magnesium-transporting ATPase (P-type)
MVGDIVKIQTHKRIPADGLIIDCSDELLSDVNNLLKICKGKYGYPTD